MTYPATPSSGVSDDEGFVPTNSEPDGKEPEHVRSTIRKPELAGNQYRQIPSDLP
jgi:hypothetical protein